MTYKTGFSHSNIEVSTVSLVFRVRKFTGDTADNVQAVLEWKHRHFVIEIDLRDQIKNLHAVC